MRVSFSILILLAVAVLGGQVALSMQEAPAVAPAPEAAPVPAPVAENPHDSDQACDTCHTSAEPKAGDAALKHCPRPHSEANGHSDKEAPDVFLIDKLSEIYVGVVFPHKLHAAMTEMVGGCETCHHRNPPGPILQCSQCHNGGSDPADLNMPGLKGAYHRQCLGCHREWTHETDCVVCHAKRIPGQAPPAKPDPTDIMGKLHPNIEVPDLRVYKTAELTDTPVVSFHHKEHVEAFGLKCTACHVEESCSSCHDAQNHVPKPRTDPHQDCAKCHEKEIGDDCTYCHKAEETKGFNHEAVTGHALKPFHQTVQCRKCHEGEGRMQPVTKTQCAECHAADWIPENFDHAQTGKPLDELHAGLDCADCHTEGLDKPVTCKTCHDDGRTAFKAPEAEAAPEDAPAPEAVAPVQ
ncbi:MAG: cytochrome c3 family protein [FCB group bacterium]|jgi:hypothetical protein|nr:cytochrome c3 family protein [FCB group bacterium]